MKTRVLFACVLSGFLSLSQPLQAEDEVRVCIQKSIPYLEQAGTEWIEKRKCISCHRISFMTWGFREATLRGFDIDRNRLQERLTWSVDTTITPDPKRPAACNQNPDGIGQLLIGHSVQPFALAPDDSAALVAELIKVQREEGSWKPAGQLPSQKRPADETAQVSTLWNTIGLGHAPATDAIHQSRRRALEFLSTAKPGKSTEWYAAQLVLSVQEQKADQVKERVLQLKSLQHDDGGWGWLTADPSDALATGQALYALSVARTQPDDAAIRKAQQFLINSQQPDGSWQVKGTKEGKKNKFEETASYWGSAWATLGLLQSFPLTSQQDK